MTVSPMAIPAPVGLRLPEHVASGVVGGLLAADEAVAFLLIRETRRDVLAAAVRVLQRGRRASPHIVRVGIPVRQAGESRAVDADLQRVVRSGLEGGGDVPDRPVEHVCRLADELSVQRHGGNGVDALRAQQHASGLGAERARSDCAGEGPARLEVNPGQLQFPCAGKAAAAVVTAGRGRESAVARSGESRTHRSGSTALRSSWP